MKIALAQIKMSQNIDQNLQKAVDIIKVASSKGVDLVLFPEIQLTPFFPQYEKRNVDAYIMSRQGKQLGLICETCKKYHIYASPNLYIEEHDKRYDMSFLINREGEVIGTQKMVHIAQAKEFYEQDYYTPSEEGFHVYDTEFGKIGIVICFDRHYPESIRTSTLKGAELILIPTANVKSEPLEMFECEVKVQAFQNSTYIAMCNRVGTEDNMNFAGNSIVVGPDGATISIADQTEQILFAEIDLQRSKKLRNDKPYTDLRRPEVYV